MSTFDQASLVMIPSGYKTSKVYSIKPTDGSGDMSFSRSNDTATRVNSAGLIEKVRTNLYTYSQSFANAAWLTLDVTEVSTSATDPNGGTTAANITWTAGSGRYFYQNIGISSVATISFWVKSNGGGNSFRLFANGATSFSSNLTATSTWTRYSFAFSGNGNVGIGIANASDNSAANLLVAFAQLETGDIATDYIATTSAAVSVGPVANVPRLDYLNSSCPRLLLEPQRTNLVTYSEQLNTGSGGTTPVTANTAVSPDGYTNADTIGAGYWTKSTSQAAGTYTLSVFAKYQSSASILLYIYDGAYYQGSFNLQTGVATTSTGSPTVSMVSYGNGWYRCIVTATTASTISEVGFGSGNFYGYGLQLEAGAYATSYIPTLGAAVTRGADSSSITDLTGKGIIPSSAAYTAFFEIELLGNDNVNDKIKLTDVNNIPRAVIYNEVAAVAGWPQVEVVGLNATVKIAFRANSTQNVSFFKNGSLVNTFIDGGGGALTFERMIFDGSNGAFKIKQAILFPTALSTAECAALTA